VFVRSGTSVVDTDEPPPVPHMALPNRPPLAEPELLVAPVAPSALRTKVKGLEWLTGMLKLPVRVLGAELALWMLLAPALLVVLALVALVLGLSGSKAKGVDSVATTGGAKALASAAASAKPAAEKQRPGLLAELEGKSPESLSASELMKVAEGRAERQREAAKALREKVEENRALLDDKTVQGQLLQFVGDAETARDALAAMATGEAASGPDLLYEVWTGTAVRNDATELARALVYSKDVRPKASPALAVALELRVAETCEQFKAVLPKALKDGDRRTLHLLTKLNGKKGCGPKKADDCYACLREGDELTATINAVKSRRPPAYPLR
jgi:hypothetical protein